MAASNGQPASTAQTFADDWAGQVARAEKLAQEAEAAGQIAPHHLDGDTDEPAAEEPPADEPAKPKPAAAKKPEAKAEDEEAKAKAAEEEKNKGAVTPAERAGFREEKRKWRERRDAEQAKFEAALKDARSKFGKYEEVEALFAAGDVIGAAEKLAGEKWNELNKKAAKRFSGADPRVDLLEKRLAEAEEARAKAEAERAEREQREAYTREQQRWMAGLKDELSSDEDPVISGLAASSLGFLDHVFQLQEQDYDPDTGETLTPREAAEKALPHWQSMYEDLAKVFGDRPANKAEGSSNGAAHRKGSTSAKPGVKAPTTLSQRKAAEASPPERADLDEAAWLRKYKQKLRESTPT